MRNEVYHFFVEGTPKAQPRPRRGKYGNFFNPDTADPWKAAIEGAVLLGKRKLPLEGPVLITIRFMFHKAGLFTDIPHTSKPDNDNLQKSTLDVLTKMRVWKDDAQVYSVNSQKYWTGGPSGAEVWIGEVTN